MHYSAMMWEEASIPLSPEQELVLASIRLDRTMDTRITELLHQELDWAALLQFAYHHNVLPLLYERLRALGAERENPEGLSRLKNLNLTIVQRNLRLAYKLAEIVQLLSNHGIASVAFKGPILALQAYGSLFLRTYEDLDILVHKEDIPRLYDLLIQSGYNPISPMHGPEQKWWVRSSSHFIFTHQRDLLEFHWTPMEKGFLFPMRNEYYWKDLKSIFIDGQEVRTLSPEFNLLLLCLHGTKHEWYQLKWIADLAHLIQSSPDLDWPVVLELARRLGFYRILCLSLLLAEDVGGAILSPQIHALFQDDQQVQVLALQNAHQVIKGKNPEELDRFPVFFLRCRERWQHRLYYVFDQVFVPKWVDWHLLPLPMVLYPIYYLIRPFRLLFKFSWIFFSAPMKH